MNEFYELYIEMTDFAWFLLTIYCQITSVNSAGINLKVQMMQYSA